MGQVDWGIINNQPGIGQGGNAFDGFEKAQARMQQQQQQAELRRQFELRHGLDVQQFGLQKDQFGENKRQFDSTYSLQKNTDTRQQSEESRRVAADNQKRYETGVQAYSSLYDMMVTAQNDPAQKATLLDWGKKRGIIDEKMHADLQNDNYYRLYMEKVKREKEKYDIERIKGRSEAEQAQAKADQMHPGYAVRAAKQSIEEARRNNVVITPEQERDILTKAAQPKPQVNTLKEGETLYSIGPDGKPQYMPGPTGGNVKTTAETRKEIAETDDFILQTQSAIGALNEALRLNKIAYSGAAAGGRATVQDNVWSTESSQATKQLQNVVINQALSSLRSTFGGNPTEGERKILLDVAGSISDTVQGRQNTFDRAMVLAQQRLEFNRQKAKLLREDKYYRPDGQPPAADVPINLAPRAPGSPAASPTAPQQAAPRPAASEPVGATRDVNGRTYVKTPEGWVPQ